MVVLASVAGDEGSLLSLELTLLGSRSSRPGRVALFFIDLCVTINPLGLHGRLRASRVGGGILPPSCVQARGTNPLHCGKLHAYPFLPDLVFLVSNLTLR